MQLKFKTSDVKKIVEHTKASTEHITIFTEKIGPSLILVGDHGVYLMSSAKNEILGEDGKNFVVYAEECNPNTMGFDDWYENKRNSFGGDDGAEPVDIKFFDFLKDYKKPFVIMDINAQGIFLVF